MSYLTLTRIDGDPDELLAGYWRSKDTMTAVGRDHGLILHAAARTDEGLMVVNLWPSQDGSEAASRDERRLGVVAEHGLEPGQIRPAHYEVEHHVVFER
jgi:hypothetical protein